MTRKKPSPTIVTLDCETDPFKYQRIPRPFIWGWFTDKGEYLEFRDTKSLVEHMRSLESKHIVYAHNGGFFDYQFLSDHIDAGNIMIIKGRLAKCSIGNCELRDSFLILPSSLASFEAGKLDFDYTKLEADRRENHMAEIREYLRADCESLMTIVKKFREEHKDALTLAGAAFKFWRRLSGKKGNGTGPLYERIKPYYYGGRCQALVKPCHIYEPLFYVDINSAYPHAMATLQHPIGGMQHVGRSIPEGKPYFVTFTGVSYGNLPERVAGSMSYPFGKGTFHTTSWEFETARELGLIEVESVDKVIWFEETTDFSEYVNHWFSKRMEAKAMGDKAGEKICKLFLNSLYGKYASNPMEYKRFFLGEEAPDERFKVMHHMIDRRHIWARELEKREMNFYFLPTAASITGAVRANLMRSLSQVDRPIYCDTDSILCHGTGDLKIGKELGEWDIEFRPVEAHVAGRKLYALRGPDGTEKVASKGAQLELRDIVTLVDGGTVIWASDAPTMRLGHTVSFVNRRVAVDVE